ncbi:MAG: tetratricopeptide repeat protein [Acidobacteriota bacterium]|nr:tetratricopeptide repeat protein [Acidobacteriota bacterium]
MNTQVSATSELERAARAMSENRWSDAIADLRTAHEHKPDDVQIAGKFGFALSRDECYSEAIRVFEELHLQHPQDPKWPYMIGYQYYQKKSWSQAVDWFGRAVALRPGYVKALYRKGYAHTALAQEQEAVNSLSDCISYWEKMSPDEQERDRSNYGRAQFQLGKVYLKKGLSLKARRHLEIAAKIDPHNHDVLYELGQCHLKNNQLDDALRELQAADQIKPGTDYILDRIAQTYAKKGDFAAAERVYEQIPTNRRRPFISQHLGMLYVEQGKHQEALPQLELAVRRQPDNHNVHYFLGRAQEGTGKLREAHASYTRAVNYRKTKYNLEFKDAEEALKRTTEMLGSLPSEEVAQTSQNDAGVIESYNESRGFGFISNKSQERIFFHVSSFAGQQKPRQGSSVIFSSEPSPKGLRAVHVELAIK